MIKFHRLCHPYLAFLYCVPLFLLLSKGEGATLSLVRQYPAPLFLLIFPSCLSPLPFSPAVYVAQAVESLLTISLFVFLPLLFLLFLSILSHTFLLLPLPLSPATAGATTSQTITFSSFPRPSLSSSSSFR